MLKIFIVEDNKLYAKTLQHQLSLNPENEVEVFGSGKELFSSLHHKPDLITLDYRLPDMTGDQVLSKVKEQLPNTPVIMVSGQEDIVLTLLRLLL